MRLSVRIGIVSFVLGTLLLSSCTPSVAGATTTNPFTDLSKSNIVDAGATWYFDIVAPPEAWGFSLREANRMVGNDLSRSPELGETDKADVTSHFSISSFEAPEGWVVRMSRATMIREVVDLDRQGWSYTFDDTLHVVFSVDIPPETPPGFERINVTIQRRNGDENTIPIRVIVAAEH